VATFVDSHVHLADAAFESDREAVIERARLTGARALLCIGESLDAARAAARLAAAHPGYVFHSAGIHPHDARAFDAAHDVPQLRQIVEAGAVAVGECGLDYHYDHSPRERQLAAFEAQIEIARELRRPLVVHTRNAVDDTGALVAAAGRDGVTGVLHCFTGPRELGQIALDAGWHLSFSGVITFRSWTDEALLRFAPVERMLVESDAPYLAPVPNRGKRNEPAWVSLTLARLASARGLATDRLGEITAENAARLFSLPMESALA
jgi:TatD DNase family protein